MSRFLRIVVALLVGTSLTDACTPQEGKETAAAPAAESADVAPSPAADSPLAQAIEQARVQLVPLLPSGESPAPAVLAGVAAAAIRAGDAARAELGLRLLGAGAHEADVYVAIGSALLEAKRAEEARAWLIAGERAHLDDARFAPLIERTIDEDPRYQPAMRTLVPDLDLDAIKQLGGGSTIVLRLMKAGEPFAVLKPKQKRLQSDPRAEIAAWRICPLVRCGYEIPYNEPVRLRWRDFDGLYSRIRSEAQRSYRDANFQDLSIVKEDGEDWIVGTKKDWVPDFTDFPIEITQIWRPWLSLEQDETILEGPATASLSAIRKLHPRAKLEAELERHMGDLTRRELARQLSNMLALDFLINNWDRFSGVPEFWGVNCQFRNGHLLSIDNGASFPRTPNEKVDKQLRRVQRFSRQFVKAVRALDHDKTLARLFPNATPFEVERYETFWTQRELFLGYVDGLVAEHGEAKVMAFD